jgi:hypothetical protein
MPEFQSRNAGGTESRRSKVINSLLRKRFDAGTGKSNLLLVKEAV